MRPRFNFTLAHELGHWILHRRFFVDDDGHSLLFNDEDLPDIICRSTGRRPPSERQADAFAGCLLIPQRLLRPAWRALTGSEAPISDTDVETRTPHVDPARDSFIDGDDEHSPDPRRLLRETFSLPGYRCCE
ncbi:ImmA/IrrE family metallo-endopeptidase [Roseiconus lacunae]|uniref:ImmA/IrrE family metallo-endopeptidase n=1 Tax=Roseiconus lacunae TaxID=2605694 RepID=A0ABT7PFG7_9BACT|nr:ImmA/IrrE family metallo-endopeptidase [Roseiconus lacunae]MDM4015239.1 ImmA/IrrE family metallo-endopeptidase [Roseiconus lacunae]